MLTSKVDFGHIVWLTKEEIECQEVMKEIERLKTQGRVAVFCPGGLNAVVVIERLLKENRELNNS